MSTGLPQWHTTRDAGVELPGVAITSPSSNAFMVLMRYVLTFGVRSEVGGGLVVWVACTEIGQSVAISIDSKVKGDSVMVPCSECDM